MISSSLRWSAQRVGRPAPPDPPGTPNRLARAMELDPKSRAVAFSKRNGPFVQPRRSCDDDRSVMIGVPRQALALTDGSAVIVAGGSHLVWNDDASSPPNSR